MKPIVPIILLILGLVIHVAGGGVFSGGTLLAATSAGWLIIHHTREDTRP